MTHVYDDYGRRRAVTAVQAGPCTIIGVREPSRHGYRAVQLGFEPVKEGDLSKPVQGQFKKAGTTAFRHVREFRIGTGGGNGQEDWAVGHQVTVELFQQYELVDVTGLSIGKGFQGGMKRWHWRGGGATHGSTSHRAPGSIGSTTTPGRVWRGHHLPGHMGDARVTVENVRIARVEPAHHLLLIEGAIPGARRGLVFITKSEKRPGVIRKPQAFQTVVEEEETSARAGKVAAKKKF